MPDFVNLSLEGIIGLLLIFGAVDTIGSILIALSAGTFSGEYVTGFLTSHVAKVWFPIFGLALVGHGVPAFDVPAIPEANLGVAAALAAYGVATLASLKGSLGDKSSAPA